MEPREDVDPFQWDVARVIEELCTPNRSWDAPPPAKLPDPNGLYWKLHELGVDGESLLTYEDTAGTLKDLLVDLGIKKIPHQLSIRRAIKQFQSRSADYQRWKRKNRGLRSDDSESDVKPAQQLRHSIATSATGDEPTTAIASASPGPLLSNGGRQGSSSSSPALEQPLVTGQASQGVQLTSAGLQPVSPTRAGGSHPSPAYSPDEPPKKKQRIAPTVLTTVPSGTVFNMIPTEADFLIKAKSRTGSSYPESASDFSYLGSGGLTFSDMFSPDMPTGEERSLKEFSFIKIGKEFPGRRLQVNRAFKRYLLQNQTSAVKDTVSDPDDELLPVFGESEDEVDSETWREFEKEEAEREQLEALKKSFLSKDEIDHMIGDAIKSYEDDWNEKKKPRQLMKAYKLWNDARRHNSRQRLISKAAKLCRDLDKRIDNISRDLRSQQWSTRESLQNHMEHFELSVNQRQAERLRIRILSSRDPPPKPSDLPRPPVRKKALVVRDNYDEEVLTSDSDEGLDDFIVDDEDEQAPVEGEFGLSTDENLPLDDLAQDDRPVDEHHPGLEADGSLFEDGHMGDDEAAEDHEDRRDSTPAAVDPMDIDRASEFNASGSRSPISVFDPRRSSTPDWTSVTLPAQQNVQQTRPIEDTDRNPTRIEDNGTRLESAELAQVSASSISPRLHTTPSVAHESVEPPEISKKPNSAKIAEVANRGVKYWADLDKSGDLSRDRRGMLIALLSACPSKLRQDLFTVVNHAKGSRQLWEGYILRAITQDEDNSDAEDIDIAVAFALAQLFNAFLKRRHFEYPHKMSLPERAIERISLAKGRRFHKFIKQLKCLIPGFLGDTGSSEGATEGEHSEGDNALESESLSDDMPISPSKRTRRVRMQKRKTIMRDSDAADIRETNFEQRALFEGRKHRLRETLANVSKDLTKFIVNETKEDDEELVYINPRAREAIKPHQIEGVRFMWNQIVVKAKIRQGCLLAHTMGLGKTMQVITLLVAIAEAASSRDKAMHKQIPQELRKSQTLILCPAGLVDNWIDELNIWTPEQGPDDRPLKDNEVAFLGRVYKLEASVPQKERAAYLYTWQRSGGVLVMGYPMFLQLARDKQLLAILLETPNMIVADEAHKLKGKNSQIHQATQDFRARSRIAMTGSPLANNVADYYHMISWVAPNYLGPYSEFRDVYESPVLVGLYADSTPAEKRHAIKSLSVLKETVAPLVHRMGILSLKDDLPQKKEFVLYLSLTPLQLAVYRAYLTQIVFESGMTNTGSWAFINDLALLLAHPSIYQKKLKRQQKERKSSASTSLDRITPRETPDEGDTEAEGRLSANENLALSEGITSHLLATLSARDLQNIDHSWKILMLNRILDECRRIGDKVLVFSQHIDTLDYLEEMFRRQRRNWFRLDGMTKISDRQASIKKFNADEKAEVYLISTKAGGVGLNIHGANRVVVFDFKYVPMEEQQAVGRAFRIGQTKPVFVYWLIVAETFEESIQNRSVFKMQLASRVVDKKNPISWSKRKVDLFPKDGKLPGIPKKSADIPSYSGKDVVLDSLLDSQDLGDGIRKIIMTETFEEEEPDDSLLTTDDRKEISDRVASFHQRSGNALGAGHTAYLAEMQSSLLGQAGLPVHMRKNQPQAPSNSNHSPLGTSGPTGNASGASTAIPAAAPRAIVPGERIAASISAETANAVGPLPSSSNTGSHGTGKDDKIVDPKTNLQVSGVASSSQTTALPPLRESRALGNMAPIAGTGTQIRPLSTGQPPFQANLGSGLRRNIDAKLRHVHELLWTTYNELEGDIARAASTPQEFKLDLEAMLRKHPDIAEDLMMLDYCSALANTVEKSRRLRMALLCGLVTAENIGTTKRQDLSNLVKKYDDMDEATFLHKLSQVTQGTSHVHVNVRISGSPEAVIPTGPRVDRLRNRTTAASAVVPQGPIVRSKAVGGMSMGVEKELRVLRDGGFTRKTKRRKPHLPEWAQQAVAEGSKSPNDVVPTPSQLPLPRQPSEPLSLKPQPFEPRQPPPPQPTPLRAGDSLDNALVID